MANPVGSALGFVVPPVFVYSTIKDSVENEIMNLMIAEAVLASLVFLLIVLFFRDKPVIPPSASA